MQAEFATRFLLRLKQWGFAPPSKRRRYLLTAAAAGAACDEVLFDLKIMDSETARRVLNINQPRVLENFRLLDSEGSM
jgi:pyruvate formate lyase activating enzyme